MAREQDTDELLDSELRHLLARLKLAFRRARGAGGEGLRRALGRTGRHEFSDFRDYEPGDDLRDLDWSAYARLEKLFIKEYEHRSTEPVTLLLDSSASMSCGQPDKWRYGRRLSLALAYLSLLGRHRVRVLLLGENQWLGPYDRSEKIETLAARLQITQTTPRENLGDVLRSQSKALSAHGRYVLVSDLWAKEPLHKALLAAQGPARKWTVLHLMSADEVSPRLEGPLRLRDAEGGEPIEFHIDANLLQAYRRAFEQHLQRWDSFCHRYRIGHMRMDTRQPLEEALLTQLRDGGLLE